MILERVISGGQTGADQAGLFAAEECGIATGGYTPRAFRTLFGSCSELGSRFGLIPLSSDLYPPRTARNVQEADATVRLASNFGTAGERCTLRYIEAYAKPYWDVELDGSDYQAKARQLAFFLRQMKVRTLNVAGNADRDKRFGRHFHEAKMILVWAFKELKEHHGN